MSWLSDKELVSLLRWALPRMQLRFRGFRRVRGQVRKRIGRRMRALALESADGYRQLLESSPAGAGEWLELDRMCRITISRFGRERRVFERLSKEILPTIADAVRQRGDAGARIWSAGCASGEEPYSIAIAWSHAVDQLGRTIVASDVDPVVLERARRARYPEGALRELPPAWREAAFVQRGDELRLRPELALDVTFELRDVRGPGPPGPFDLVLCRYLAFTYYATDLQHRVLGELKARLRPGGFLVIGANESLPRGTTGLGPWAAGLGVYRRNP